jgi:hypothetical protein
MEQIGPLNKKKIRTFTEQFHHMRPGQPDGFIL